MISPVLNYLKDYNNSYTYLKAIRLIKDSNNSTYLYGAFNHASNVSIRITVTCATDSNPLFDTLVPWDKSGTIIKTQDLFNTAYQSIIAPYIKGNSLYEYNTSSNTYVPLEDKYIQKSYGVQRMSYESSGETINVNSLPYRNALISAYKWSNQPSNISSSSGIATVFDMSYSNDWKT